MINPIEFRLHPDCVNGYCLLVHTGKSTNGSPIHLTMEYALSQSETILPFQATFSRNVVAWYAFVQSPPHKMSTDPPQLQTLSCVQRDSFLAFYWALPNVPITSH